MQTYICFRLILRKISLYKGLRLPYLLKTFSGKISYMILIPINRKVAQGSCAKTRVGSLILHKSPGVAGASGAVARAPRQPLHVTTWLAPRHPHASRPFPVGEMLADSPFKRGVVLPITATSSASSVTASSLFPQSLLSTIRHSQSFRMASFGSVRFCSLFPYGHFFAALAPIYHSRTRPL